MNTLDDFTQAQLSLNNSINDLSLDEPKDMAEVRLHLLRITETQSKLAAVVLDIARWAERHGIDDPRIFRNLWREVSTEVQL